MYKKILRIFLTLTNLLIAFLAIYLVISTDNNAKILQRTILDESFTQIGLPKYPTSNSEYQKIVQAFQDTSKELNIPIIKKIGYQGAGGNEFINFEVSNLSTTSLSQNFNQHFQNGKTYSTKKLSNSMPLQKYGDVDFTVKPLSKNGNREGLFYIESIQTSSVKAFQKLLCKNINTSLHSHYQPKNFTSYTLPTDDDVWTIDYSWIQTALISLIIFQIFFYFVYLLSSAHELGIFKLTGHSSLFAFKKLILLELTIGFLIPLSSLLIYIPFSKRGTIFIPAVKLLAFFFIGEVIISFVLIFLAQQISIKKLLQGFTSSKGIFYTLFITKGILLVYIILNFLPIAQAELSFISSVPKNSIYQNYANIFPSYIGYNPERLTNNNLDYHVNHDDLYPIFDKNKALYIDTSDLSGANATLKFRTADVNSNYLQHFLIKDEKNKKVNIKSFTNSHSYIVLLPEKYRKYKSSIINKLQSDYHNLYQSSLKPHKKYKFDIKFIYIKNNQPIYNEKGHKVYNYTYINVITPDNYQLNTLDIGLGQAADCIKIPLVNKSVKQTYQKYYPVFKKYNMVDNFPGFIRSSEYQTAELNSELEDIKYDIVPEVISVILYLIISISIIYLYFSIYGRNFAIKYTMGISNWRATISYWILWIFEISLLVLFCIFEHISLTTPTNITLFLTMAIIDLLISISSIQFFSKSTLRRFLHD